MADSFIPAQGDSVNFNFTDANLFVPTTGDKILFVFGDVEEKCGTLWKDLSSRRLKVNFKGCGDDNPTWVDQPANEISIHFDCCDKESPSEYFISGSITIPPIESVGELIVDPFNDISGNVIIPPIECIGELDYRFKWNVSGNFTFEVTSQSAQPGTSGNRVYWSNLRIGEIVCNGSVDVPLAIGGGGIIDEIKSVGSVYVYPTNSNYNIQICEVIANRGYVEVGPPFAPAFRQIFESSNARSMDVVSHPEDAKYPVYVPTTDYTLENVELRRGTLEYTIQFQFDAIQVNRIIVWKMDQNGNATKDSTAKYLGGPLTPHEFQQPMRYSVMIPVHCVSSKEFEFFLEVEYYDIRKEQNETVFHPERKSHIVPFQAHYDRNPFMNMTDRFQIMGSYGGMPTIQSFRTDFVPTVEFFNDKDIVIGGLAGLFPLFGSTTYFQTQITFDAGISYSVTIGGLAGLFPSFFKHYDELDIGQIGGN